MRILCNQENTDLQYTGERPAKAARGPLLTSLLTTLSFLILIIALLPSASAAVDLIAPNDGTWLSNSTVDFTYYAGLPGISGCTVDVNGTLFPDPIVTPDAINTVQIQGVAPGNYLWNVTCESTVGNETSATRAFGVDFQPPTLALIAPTNGTIKNFTLDLIASDDLDRNITCAATWNAQFLQNFDVQRGVRTTVQLASGDATAGNGTLAVVCTDDAGQSALVQRQLQYLPDYSLQLSLDKQEYALTEPVRLTVLSANGSNVTVDVCPDQQGFVQCTSALITSTTFPQTITLPYLNKTGPYLVEAVSRLGGQTRINQTRYALVNSIGVVITLSGTPKVNTSVTYTATVIGGIAPYRATWVLPNGTVRQTTVVDGITTTQVWFPTSGSYPVRITVFDAANNTRQANVTSQIAQSYPVEVRVTDNQTGQVIPTAMIEFDDVRLTTVNGIATYSVPLGTYELYASAEGYRYVRDDVVVTGAISVSVRLARDAPPPVVTITAPIQSNGANTTGTTFSNPVRIAYGVTAGSAATCTLFIRGQSNWYAANGSNTHAAGSTNGEFIRTLPEGRQDIKVECTDALGKRDSVSASFLVAQTAAPSAQPAAAEPTATAADQGTSPALDETTAPTAPATDDELRLQQYIEQLDGVLALLEQSGQSEREIITTIGFDRNIRNSKRAVQQAIRDIGDLQYRTGIDETTRAAERTRIIGETDAAMQNTPLGITVVDTKTYVKYLEEEDVDAVSRELAGNGGFPEDPSRIAKGLLDDQQRFTVSTKIAQVDYLYDDRQTKSVTVVMRTFTYAKNLSPAYKLYEVIPKEVSQNARELTLLTKGEIIKEDPVLRFDQTDRITYVIPRRVDFTRAEEIKTVLARMPEQGTTATGFAILGADLLSTRSAIIVAAIIVALWLAWYFDLLKQLRFLSYRIGRKERVHYVRVLINDAVDNLDGNNYDKADMLYKEIRLTYDTLSTIEKNELYDEIAALVKRMDEYYFNLIMIELDRCLKAGDMDGAISEYEKLTGTFERLDEEHQRQLVDVVTGMARRIGAGVPT